MDITLFQFLHSFIGKSSILDSLAIFLAKHLPYLLALVALVFILRRKFWKERIFVFVMVALTAILSTGVFTRAIRFFYDRPRPFKALGFEPIIENSSPAFPSAHAAFFFALALAIFYFDRRAGIWFFVFAVLNSLARVALGLHWPSDILGGVLVAFVSYMIVDKLIGVYKPKQAIA